MNDTPLQSESVPADFDDVFDDWISGATIAKRSVQIYGNPGLMAEYEQLNRELKLLQDQAPADEESLGQDDDVTRIRERLAGIYADHVASKSTWTVRALSKEPSMDAIQAELAEAGFTEPDEPVEPKEPAPLPAKRTPTQVKAHEKAVQEWETARTEYVAALEPYTKARSVWSTELNLRIVVHATVKIEFADGRTVEAEISEDGDLIRPAVSLDRIRRLKQKLGQRQIVALISASQLAALEEPVIEAPFSQSTSEDDPT